MGADFVPNRLFRICLDCIANDALSVCGPNRWAISEVAATHSNASEMANLNDVADTVRIECPEHFPPLPTKLLPR